jgi:hypothetical protein
VGLLPAKLAFYLYFQWIIPFHPLRYFPNINAS